MMFWGLDLNGLGTTVTGNNHTIYYCFLSNVTD